MKKKEIGIMKYATTAPNRTVTASSSDHKKHR
jgi:hypothetical protein